MSRRQAFDVFLSHDPVDAALARAVADRLQGEGVSVYSAYVSESQPVKPTSDSVRREIHDAFAFAVLLTPTFLKADILPLHTGAAVILDIPVYVLTSGVEADEVPSYLSQATCGRLWEGLPAVATDIRRQAAPFTAERTQAVLDAYQDVGVPVDKLLTDSGLRTEFTRKFTQLAGGRTPAERVVRELVRLRKSGKLPRLAVRTSK